MQTLGATVESPSLLCFAANSATAACALGWHRRQTRAPFFKACWSTLGVLFDMVVRCPGLFSDNAHRSFMTTTSSGSVEIAGN
jgi:hypothetical protein